MRSSRKQKRQSGSEQVGEWRFTYEDRIHSFEDLEYGQGISALSAYAALYGRLERKLFGRYCAGVSLPSLKSEYLLTHRIPARMFNGLRVSLEGKIAAVRESQSRQIKSLGRRISRAERQIAGAEECGKLAVAHHKRRRLENLRRRLAALRADVVAGRVRICFGSRRLWHGQYALEANGYSSREEWQRDWREARSGEFFVLGSKDETSGCQLCVATVEDDGKLTLRLRLPDALAEQHGKYLIMKGIHFNHGHAQVMATLQNQEGQAISYRFKRDRKGWRVFASVRHQPVPVVTDRRLGAIGVDVNVDHLAVSETDSSGNWLRSSSVPLVTYGKSRRQAEALIGDAVAEVVAGARQAGKPLVIENLDFAKKRDLLEGESPGRSRMLSSFVYGKIKTNFLSRGYREGVGVKEVNPAFSSVIGRVSFMERYGLSVDQAAALVLARRSLGCSEGIPDRRVSPDGLGGHVAFHVPARKRVKHIWTLWGAVSGQLRRALAELHWRGERNSEPPPVRAGPRFESGLGCEPVGAPGWESRGESSPCAVGAALAQPRLC